jgi:hypothetical protein
MERRKSIRIWRRLAQIGCLTLGGTGIGCALSEGGVRDPGQEPSPNGTSVNAWYEEHANRAEADDFTIHLNEWYMGGMDLGPYGLHHLGVMLRRLHEVPFPIIISPHLDSAMNERRRQLIVKTLEQQGVGDAEQRVAIAYPQAEGLYAEEGVFVYYDMFQNRSGYNGNGGFGAGGRRGGGAFGGIGNGLGGFGGGYGGGGGGGYGGGGSYGYGPGGGYGGAGYGTYGGGYR